MHRNSRMGGPQHLSELDPTEAASAGPCGKGHQYSPCSETAWHMVDAGVDAGMKVCKLSFTFFHQNPSCWDHLQYLN